MNENVLIPRTILEKTLDLFETLAISNLPDCYEYCNLFFELKLRLLRFETRDAYEKIFFAVDEGTKFNARNEYLRLRRELRNLDAPVYEVPF